MNVISISGNVTKDAELRFLPNGDPVASFSVADNQGKDKDAIFWQCSLFGKRGESLSQYLLKGTAVTVNGEVTERKWKDNDGIDRWTKEVRVNNVALQGGKRQEEGNNRPKQQAPSVPDKQPTPKPAPDFADMDDEIPF